MAQPDALDPRAVERAIEPAEATLLRLLLVHPGRYAATAARLAEDPLAGRLAEDPLAGRLAEGPFVTTPARELWRALGAALAAAPDAALSTAPTAAPTAAPRTAPQADAGRGFDRAAFIAGLEPTLATVAQTLLARTDPLPAGEAETDQAIDQSLLTLERARLSERIEFTRARLAEAEASHDGSELDILQHEVLELQRRRLELDRAVDDSSLLARRRIHPKPSAKEVEVAHGD